MLTTSFSASIAMPEQPEPFPRAYAPGVVDERTGRAHRLGGLDDRIATPGGDDAGDQAPRR